MDELKDKIISMISDALDYGNLDLADRLIDMYVKLNENDDSEVL